MRLSLFAAIGLLSFSSVSYGNGIIFIGPDAGPLLPPVIRFDTTTNTGGIVGSVPFSGGVRVAAGRFNSDGIPDVVVAQGAPGGPGGSVLFGLNGATGVPLFGTAPFGPSYNGGLFVGAADINGDGVADKVVAPDIGGPPTVISLDGATGAPLMPAFFAYGSGFTGGVRVASGDINGDGFADIVTGAGPGGGPHVKAFDGVTGGELQSFFAYGPSFTGGVYVAAGDVNGDGRADIITGAGASSAGPHVRVFDGATLDPLASFFAYPASFAGGVRVGVTDTNLDGIADIVTAPGPGGGPHVKVFDGNTFTELRSFFAYDPGFTGGLFVAGIAPLASPIPEPTSAALMIAGGLGVWIITFRSRRRAARQALSRKQSRVTSHPNPGAVA